jgi:hypothetical protein
MLSLRLVPTSAESWKRRKQINSLTSSESLNGESDVIQLLTFISDYTCSVLLSCVRVQQSIVRQGRRMSINLSSVRFSPFSKSFQELEEWCEVKQ